MIHAVSGLTGEFTTLVAIVLGLITFLVGATTLIALGVDDQYAGVLAGMAAVGSLWSIGLAPMVDWGSG
ncbi:hypothetical protein OB955_17485 [Halobacteria archaeon AArc-m2/3/4]|uniref:Uncharacterized protein n=1 Tax=Natronoglomus mannanivorans TaxID=2979990 RepID=A0AAP3E279_9EURY|nr:hypothetical protein [Halobacteria archaeon AArc-xg1-1]MCU4974515.1 hypothetical protein [Halobacteria archaeon AArc-m2/3/4]